MNDNEQCQTLFGRPLVGVTISKLKNPDLAEQNDRFCTHVWHTMLDGRPRTLGASSIRCAGAKYVLGFREGDQPPEQLVSELYKEGRAESLADSRQMVGALCRLRDTTSIHLVRGGKGDVHICYLPPAGMMRLVQAYHKIMVEPPQFLCPSLAPVCGVATAQAYCTKKLCLSFGCGDSRRYGGIGEGDVVVGIPHAVLLQLQDSISDGE